MSKKSTGSAAKGSKKKAKKTETSITSQQVMAPAEGVTKAAKVNKGRSKALAATQGDGKKAKADKPLSCLDAAVAVLKAKGEPMRCQEMIEAMKEQKLWTGDAPTPAATLSSAILREMKKKDASRFTKTGPGLFAVTASDTK